MHGTNDKILTVLADFHISSCITSSFSRRRSNSHTHSKKSQHCDSFQYSGASSTVNFPTFLASIFDGDPKLAKLSDRRAQGSNYCYCSHSHEVVTKTKSCPPPPTGFEHIGHSVRLVNTLRTGDADLRFYVTTVQDG